MADEAPKVMSWAMIIGLMVVTALAVGLTLGLLQTVLGLRSGIFSAGVGAATGIIGAGLIARRAAALKARTKT
ncbi:MAG TPA: hypothetical protein VG389_07945 [Myxococcota bacterium]|jgi:hypothetical protein|nr:hypothetical protein [Myxococcota bacterium]